MADYATVGDFKAWINLTDPVDDDVIARALTAASSAIDRFCSTHFWKTATGTARFFDTCDTWRLRINDAAAVSEVAADTGADGTFDMVWTAPDFQLLPLNPDAGPETLPFSEIRAVGTLRFPRPTSARAGLVRVKGEWGWPTIPEPVSQATMLTANRLIKRRRSPEGVAGFDEFGTIRISTRDDPDAVRLLTPYRTKNRVGGWALA